MQEKVYKINTVPLMERVDSHCHFAFVVSMKFWGDLNMNHSTISPFNNRESITVSSIH